MGAGAWVVLGWLAVASPARAERVWLDAGTAGKPVQAAVMKPFDVYLVAERDSLHPQMSAVAYTLQVPDGVVVLGEELLVESLLGLGTSRAGMNLVFRCTDQWQVRVLHFRFAATKPVDKAVVALRPDTRTHFLGLVACRDENFAKFESVPDSVVVNAR
jgi:hypothetical protein